MSASGPASWPSFAMPAGFGGDRGRGVGSTIAPASYFRAICERGVHGSPKPLGFVF
jgi:hypothetical protein